MIDFCLNKTRTRHVTDLFSPPTSGITRTNHWTNCSRLKRCNVFEAIYKSVVEGDAKKCVAEIKAALDAGADPAKVLNEGMIAAMAQVGCYFEQGEYYVPEMLVSARAMQEGLKLLKPRLVEADVKPVAKIVIGTVKGDLHDIGKNLVAMMLEGAGFEVIDLGVDVAPDKFVNAVRQHQPRFIGMSALLTTTMPMMVKTVDALKAAGLRNQVVVMIGGAPVTEQFAKQIGADLFAPDASSSANRAKTMLA
ncbi:MAG: corrinoid protein [Chloroflexi bacterium]|nr:corrinoid protein [Chloroflexota bacterium]